jgi:hypothetical protein
LPRGLTTACHIAHKADACGCGTAYNAPVNYFDTPAILPGALIERRLEAVGAVAYDVFGIALEAGALQYRTERDACPLPDATPALYAAPQSLALTKHYPNFASV